jgi:hypothetical protein
MKFTTYTFMMIALMNLIGVGCGQKADDSGGTTGGNPNIKIPIQSDVYTNDGSLVLFKSPYIRNIQNLFLIPSSYAAPITDFRFCITQMKIVTESGAESPEVILGLIDVSDQNTVTSWGSVKLPEGDPISQISFEVHYDPERCEGVDFSTSYNNQQLSVDLEFKFNFSPAVSVNAGDTITLGLSKIAKVMQDASDAGHFNDTDIKDYVEQLEEDAEIED